MAAFGPDDVERLMADAGIVRNRAKIEAAIANARAAAELDDLGALLWSFAPDPAARPAPRSFADVPAVTPESTAMAKALKRHGLPLRRPDHRLRADAGVRAGQRPPRGLLGAMTRLERLDADGRAPAARVARASCGRHERAPADRPFVYLNMVSTRRRAGDDRRPHAGARLRRRHAAADRAARARRRGADRHRHAARRGLRAAGRRPGADRAAGRRRAGPRPRPPC